MTGTMLALIPSMTDRRIDAEVCRFRAATDLAPDEDCAAQARRRAARWYAWLTSPDCTLQDRENFERWCSDPTNAAAYAALMRELEAVTGFTSGKIGDSVRYTSRSALVSRVGASSQQADKRVR
jgi:ferric-dicitrate binding protein FerR (iron transport regulator)